MNESPTNRDKLRALRDCDHTPFAHPLRDGNFLWCRKCGALRDLRYPDHDWLRPEGVIE